MRRNISVYAVLIWTAAGAAAVIVWGAVLSGLLFPVTPDALTLEFFQVSFLNRAASYQQVSLTVFLFRQALTFLFWAVVSLAAWRYFGGLQQVSVTAAAGYVLLFLLLFQLLNLPLDYYRGFVVEHNFALSNYTVSGWLIDYMKSVAISIAITTAALTGLYFTMVRWPGFWWLLAGAAVVIFLILTAYLYPLVVDPLFYSFTPLEDPEMNEAIISMAEEGGINIDQVLVADASRRTRKANAYFTGLGSSKRIVIFDTLLNNFTRDEILTVIGHEIGHWRHQHIAKGLVMGAGGAFLALGLFFLLTRWMGLHGDFRTIPLALLFFALISLISSPVENYISRGFERQADADALVLAGEPEAFISLKRNLALNNLSVPRPHPLIKYMLHSHPPVMERIEHALEEMRE